MRNLKLIIISITAILFVGAGAYYFSQTREYKNDYDEKDYEESYEESKKTTEKFQENIISKTTTGLEINPIENLPSANPLEGVKTNPFEGRYQNPFEL